MTHVTGPGRQHLDGLTSLTEPALSSLGVREFLSELLNRVREVLQADTAAVLLLDETTHELVATAACGIEEEVRLGVRIPVGRGFAGRIAADRRGVALTRVDTTTVANPLLWEKGIRVMLGAPLLGGSRLLGVIHVGRLDDRPFTPRDAELLAVVAERVAGVTQTRLLAEERAAAAMLERSLLPSRLPQYPGLETAARYVAPEHRTVGGDWYDLFALPSGEVCVVIGDVAGHGLPAAVVMGRVRSALRAYALISDSPEAILELTDRKVQHFEIGTMVTVICALSAPPYRELRVASAGHPPPLLASPDRPASFIELPVGLPLGVDPRPERESARVQLEDGATILFFTDGLIERRGESIDVGLEDLRRRFKSDAPYSVANDLLHRFASTPPSDDVAIVVLRRLSDEASDPPS